MSIYWDNYYYDWVKGESIVCNYLVQKPTSLQISFHKYNLTKHFPTRSSKLLEFAELNKANWTYICTKKHYPFFKFRQPLILKILTDSSGPIGPIDFRFCKISDENGAWYSPVLLWMILSWASKVLLLITTLPQVEHNFLARLEFYHLLFFIVWSIQYEDLYDKIYII